MSIRARCFVGSLSSGVGDSKGVGFLGMGLFLVEKKRVACPGAASAPVGTPPVEKSQFSERRRENNPRRPCLPLIEAARRKTNYLASVALVSRSLSE